VSGPRQIVSTALCCGVLAGCITSPTWEHGTTKQAIETRLEACPDGLIDDAEDGDNQIAKRAGRDGYWFSFKDPWGSTVTPSGKFTMSKSDREGSKFAARISGKVANTGESLYVGLGFSFTDPHTPYNAGFAKGLRFWAKGPGRVRLKVPDANTTPEGDRCKDCYNDFGVDLYLQDKWVRYTVPFEAMTQQPGWGDRTPRISSSELFAVEWQFKSRVPTSTSGSTTSSW
jgi:endoglucanase